MAQKLLQAEPGLRVAPFDLHYLNHKSCHQQYKDTLEGTPQSPLTDNSTSSSQESSAAELLDHSSSRSILAMRRSNAFCQQGLFDLATLSPGSSLERSKSSGLHYPIPDLPSPSGSLQDKCKHQRGMRSSRGSVSGEQQMLKKGSSSYRHLFKQVTKVGSGQSLVDMGFPEAALTVEHLVSLVKSLPASQLCVPTVAHGLHFMDSRAVAALLKDIAKNGLPQRAIEIFDWLRSLSSTHELHHLCDVYTYTTVIALCGQRQMLRLALELVAEMRSRGVTCNVHTFSALMNTCIKCGELELALDVFNQLQLEGCVANVVTFNTLVDVYGKLGRWQDAIKVLDQVYLQGLEPEARTFNTVIIAANICNQPLEALKVYDRMLASGFKPTDTTYTALISAYGKAGQLDNALNVFDQMVQQGCDRNIITYGSLISACERAGKWQIALALLDRMKQDHVGPNTMTYNSLLIACAQGAQSEKAESLFHSMQARRCKPDASAYSSVLLAHICAGQWRAALQGLDAMQSAGHRPEHTLYASLIQCLWEAGVPASQAHAARLFACGCRSGAVLTPLQQTNGEDRSLQVAIQAPNSSIAVLALLKWLRDTMEKLEVKGDGCLGHTVFITAGLGTKKADGGVAPEESMVQLDVQSAVATVLEGLKSVFRSDVTSSELKFVADSWELGEWLLRDETKTSIADYIPAATAESKAAPDGFACRTIAAQEASSNARLAESHLYFCQAETHQEARLMAAQQIYHHIGAREDCLRLANELARRFSISLEVVYHAMVLLDYALVADMQLGKEVGAAALVATCLTIAARLCGSGNGSVQHSNGMESALGLPPGSLLPVVDQLHRLGAAETPVASPMTALTRYLSQLLQGNISDHAKPEMPATPRVKARLAGSSRRLLTAAMADPSTQFIRPSLLAAAALAVDRKTRGYVPIWPVALARWTGIPGPGYSPLDAAMQIVTAVPLAPMARP